MTLDGGGVKLWISMSDLGNPKKRHCNILCPETAISVLGTVPGSIALNPSVNTLFWTNQNMPIVLITPM